MSSRHSYLYKLYLFIFSWPKISLSLILGFCFSTQGLALQIYRTGKPKDVSPRTTPLVCLAGGASDDAWAQGWREMMIKANGGDIVIIRADGRRGGYEPWLYEDPDGHKFPKVNSVSSIVVSSLEDANRRSVETLINQAELVFIAGGDQYNYLRFIKGSRLHKALKKALYIRKVPFGGTSAGTALLSDILFTAQYEPPTNESSAYTVINNMLKNPTGPGVSLERDFLKPPFFDRVITDSHFSERNRQGRLLAFMARAFYNQYPDIKDIHDIKAIGADEKTSVCVDGRGRAKIYGDNYIHFLIGNRPIERVQKGQTLHWFGNGKAVKVYSISGKDTKTAEFNLKTWTGKGGTLKYWYVDGTKGIASFFSDVPFVF